MMSPTKGRRDRGALEAEIIAALAAAGRPMTTAELLDQLGGGRAYTTISTTLIRLYSKGALDRVAAGRAHAYTLRGDEKQARSNVAAHRMLQLLAREHDREATLHSFIAELDPADNAYLASLLQEPPPNSAAPEVDS